VNTPNGGGTPDPESEEKQKKKHEDFLARSQGMYAERRAEGRLVNARRTLRTLDEKEGVQVSHSFLGLYPVPREGYRRTTSLSTQAINRPSH